MNRDAISLEEPGQLIYADADGRRTITVQPRFNDTTTSRVFLSLNLHKQEQRFPDEAEIQTTLKEIQQESGRIR